MVRFHLSLTMNHLTMYEEKLLKLNNKKKEEINGYEIVLKGRLKGVRRARKKVYKYKGISSSTLTRKQITSGMHINTPTGVLGIKVSVC